VALSFEKDAETALAAMANVDFSNLAEYQPYHATLADLYRRSEQLLAASEAYEQAINLSSNQFEKAYLENQRAIIQKQLS
jgi:predicted RNA polymerase sigma factor